MPETPATGFPPSLRDEPGERARREPGEERIDAAGRTGPDGRRASPSASAPGAAPASASGAAPAPASGAAPAPAPASGASPCACGQPLTTRGEREDPGWICAHLSEWTPGVLPPADAPGSWGRLHGPPGPGAAVLCGGCRRQGWPTGPVVRCGRCVEALLRSEDIDEAPELEPVEDPRGLAPLTLQRVPLPFPEAPLATWVGEPWGVLVATQGELWALDPTTGEGRRVMPLPQGMPAPAPPHPHRPNRRPVHLTASACGRWAAIAGHSGSPGWVLDLHAQAVTMQLARGDYHTEQTDFPVAFAELEGHTVVVHATDWNRVTVSAPDSGESLLPEVPEGSRGDPQPAWIQDYFYGRLLPGPGDWVLSDGWCWQPVGVPLAFPLRRWVLGDPVAPTRRGTPDLGYGEDWGLPMVWLGPDEAAVLHRNEPGHVNLRCVDLREGRETRWFPVEYATGMGVLGSLVLLWRGTRLWVHDLETGARRGERDDPLGPGVEPIAVHPPSASLLGLGDGHLVRGEFSQKSA